MLRVVVARGLIVKHDCQDRQVRTSRAPRSDVPHNIMECLAILQKGCMRSPVDLANDGHSV